MYLKEAPFENIFIISLIPTEYLGYKTMQVFVNGIDIGFIPKKETKYLRYGFRPLSVQCTIQFSPTGKPHYNFYLLGTCTYTTSH